MDTILVTVTKIFWVKFLLEMVRRVVKLNLHVGMHPVIIIIVVLTQEKKCVVLQVRNVRKYPKQHYFAMKYKNTNKLYVY